MSVTLFGADAPADVSLINETERAYLAHIERFAADNANCMFALDAENETRVIDAVYNALLFSTVRVSFDNGCYANRYDWNVITVTPGEENARFAVNTDIVGLEAWIRHAVGMATHIWIGTLFAPTFAVRTPIAGGEDDIRQAPHNFRVIERAGRVAGNRWGEWHWQRLAPNQ
jgi:hypothetical protein